MADLIVETGAGVVGANSYISADDADIFFEKRLHATAWTDANPDDKEIALMWATRLLEENVNWYGYITYDTQPLRFPRSSLTDIEGRDILQTTIPQFLKDAVSELAFHLISEDRTLETNRDLVGLKRVKVDTLDITTDGNPLAVKPVIPLSVWSIIKFYGRPYGQTRSLVRC
jgi:hypothetical protein